MHTIPRMLVTDYNGIGNGVILVPVLRELERLDEHARYFCLDNPVLRHEGITARAGLRGPAGLVPAIWRRFGPEHWEEITAFLVRERIEVVVNLRNEELDLDHRYPDYRAWLAGQGVAVEFWDLYDEAARADEKELAAVKAVRLLRRHGLPLGEPDAVWLRGFGQDSAPEAADGTRVGLFVGASQRVKRWPADRWAALAAELAGRIERPAYTVLAGLDAHERELAAGVAEAVRAGGAPVRLVEGQGFTDFVAMLCGLDLLVSNDSAAVHIAAAAGVPTAGLYMASLASVWGPRGATARGVQSPVGSACPHMKPAAGSCRLYYTGCPAPCQDGVTPGRVAEVLHEVLPAGRRPAG
jgi:ADP-heptose:LPS heptosyltransferase